MTRTKKSSRLFALATVAALALAACGGDDGGDGESGGEGVEGGTLIWAHEQEPPDMHLDDPENNLTATAWVRAALWEGLYGISAATTFVPELLAEEAVMTDNGDGTFTASYTLRDGLKWSDGDDLTADDVEYTYEMVMAKGEEDADEDGEPDYVYLLGDRTGVDTITDFTVSSPTEFTVTWSSYFGGWKALFSEVHPSHVFPADPAEAAAAENEALREWKLADGTVVPSSGPMVFDTWERGVKMTLVRNENYHGSTSPDVKNTGKAYVDGVQINFVADTDSQINALKANEAQIIMTQPQQQFEELASNDQFTVASSAGPVYEHWGFNMLNTHLKKVEVREALALAIDKGEVVEALYAPLFGDLLPTAGLGNTYWMSNQPAYVDHQADAGYGAGDIEAAQAKLEAAGYTLGADGIYEHPEDGKLTLRVGTTGGNALRELQQQLIQAQLKEAGIDIVIENGEGSAYFGDQPFNADALACADTQGAEGDCGVWDIAQFAWVGGPWPGSNSSAFRTASGNNPYGYSNADFDAKTDECDTIVDEAAAADCYNEADKYVTTLEIDPNGLVVIPLTQKPSFYAYSNTLVSAAVSPDANNAGPLVNVVDYQFGS